MNFQNIPPIEEFQSYLDIAFKRASRKASEKRSVIKGKNKVEKARQVELTRINNATGSLTSKLDKILKDFPIIEDLPEFYKEMVKATTEYHELKKALGAVNWAKKKIDEMSKKFQRMVSRCNDVERISKYRNEFYGRISSVVKQIRSAFEVLETSRKIMKKFPAVKTSLFTVSIVGFPNVGKTTLLYKLTGSKPEINNYSFTTKGINVAYIGGKTKKTRIQLLDTPGTLNRPEKMNQIEIQAYLCLKHLSNMNIYVFDLTETSYELKEQIKLYKQVKRYNTKIKTLAYVSKTDITSKEKVDEFTKKISSYQSVKQVKNVITKSGSEFYKRVKED